MPLPSTPRSCPVLVSVLAATGLVLAVASCAGHITPLGPEPTPVAMPAGATVVGPPHQVGTLRKLESPIVLQVMHSEAATSAGGCPAGSVAVSVPPGAAPMGCFRAVGSPVTINSAMVSPVFTYRPASAPGQPAQPSYGLTVSVTTAQIAAVTALITQAYDSRDALGISVGGTLWQAPLVEQPFSGQQLQIAFSSKDQALQLYRTLIPSS